MDAVLDFFALRVGGLSDRELQYVRALARLGPGERTSADVARAMGADSSTKIGAFSRRGRVALTVPRFDRYVARAF